MWNLYTVKYVLSKFWFILLSYPCTFPRVMLSCFKIVITGRGEQTLVVTLREVTKTSTAWEVTAQLTSEMQTFRVDAEQGPLVFYSQRTTNLDRFLIPPPHPPWPKSLTAALLCQSCNSWLSWANCMYSVQLGPFLCSLKESSSLLDWGMNDVHLVHYPA